MGPPAFCPSQVLEMLESLNGEWLTFQQILLDSEQMLKKHKEKFKTGLIHAADDFKKKAHNLLEDFEFKGFSYSTALPSLALVLGTQRSESPGKVKTDGGVAWRRGSEVGSAAKKLLCRMGRARPELWDSGWEGWAGSVLTLTSCPPPVRLFRPVC